MKRALVFLPFIAFIAVAVFLYRGLSLHPKDLPSVLLDQKAPSIVLPILGEEGYFTLHEMRGKVWLLNVWASWCQACLDELPTMMALSRQHIPIVGLAYKDKRSDVIHWLKDNGSPFSTVILDRDGDAAMDLGVYGAPETFLIDKRGVIRYRHLGIISQEDWQNTLKPIYESFAGEKP